MTPVAYVSGPMTGLPSFNYPAFWTAEHVLERSGWAVINPARLNPTARPWWACMMVCLWHLRLADEVRLLPGWERSRGARLEVLAAIALGLRIYPPVEGQVCTAR